VVDAADCAGVSRRWSLTVAARFSARSGRGPVLRIHILEHV
jgi:hypothetical protein